MAGQDHRGFDDDAFGTPRSSGCQRRREWSCERRPDAPPDGASGLWGARQDQTYACAHTSMTPIGNDYDTYCPTKVKT